MILIQVPALKDRKEDIPLLVDKFLEDIANEYGTKKKIIRENAIAKLLEYNWSGNIRELRNVTERLVIMCGDEIIDQDVIKYLV